MRVLQASASANVATQTLQHTPITGDVLYFGFLHNRNPTPRDVSSMTGAGATWTSVDGVTTGRRYYWYRGTGANASGSVTMTLSGSFTGGCMLIHLRPDDAAEDLTTLDALTISETIGAGITSQNGPSQNARRGKAVFTLAQGGNPVTLAVNGAGLYTPIATGSSAFMDATYANPMLPTDVAHRIDFTCPSTSYTGITQIVIGDTDPGPTPLRFYLPGTSGGAPDVSPSFAPLYSVTGATDRKRLVATPELAAFTDILRSETTNGNVDVDTRQFTSYPTFPAIKLAGSFRTSIRGVESGATDNSFLELVLRMVDTAGSSVLGTLYPGQGTHTASANSADPNYEFATSKATRILGDDITPVTLSAGARLVADYGYSNTNDGTSRSSSLRFGDPAADDLAYTVDSGSDSLRPWLEIDYIDPPEAPLNVVCDPASDSLTVTWDPPTGFGVPDGYEVRIDGGAWIDVGNVETHTFTGLDPDTAYTVDVRAYNGAGTSASASCSTDTDPVAPPEDVDCTSTSSTITLTWSTPSNDPPIDGYEVRIDGGAWLDVGDVNSHTFTGLDPETSHTVEVRSYIDAGQSVAVECSTDTAAVTAPGDVACEPTLTTITLTWTEPVNDPPVTGYEVRVGGGPWLDVGNVLTYTFEDLTPGTEYTVEVRAYIPTGFSAGVTCTATTLIPACDDCDVRWLIESCGITTGRVRAVLNPTMFDVQTSLNVSGQGSMTFPTRDVKIRDIWPRLAMVAISRIVDDPTNPEGIFLGWVEELDAQGAEGGGTTRVGLVEITTYAQKRRLRATMEFTNVQQTQIAAEVFNAVIGSGVVGSLPITALWEPSAYRRDRIYNSWDRLTVADIITGLADIENGIDWEVTYARVAGEWSATIIFRDEVGDNRGVSLASDREADAYGLVVSGANHATWVDAIGEGEEEAMLIATARDLDGIYPQFDEVTTYKEVGVLSELREYARGDLARMKEPAAIPSLTVSGNSPAPSMLRLGDTVDVNIDAGAITYHGDARLVDITWAMGPESPDTRTLNFTPITRPSESVLNQTPTEPCEDC